MSEYNEHNDGARSEDHGDRSGGHREHRSGEKRFDRWFKRQPPMAQFLMFLGFVGLGIGAFVLFGHVFMALWNWLMPEIFGLGTIDFWQGYGLILLSSILFKGSSSSDNKRDYPRRWRRKNKIRKIMEEDQNNSPTEESESE